MISIGEGVVVRLKHASVRCDRRPERDGERVGGFAALAEGVRQRV